MDSKYVRSYVSYNLKVLRFDDDEQIYGFFDFCDETLSL